MLNIITTIQASVRVPLSAFTYNNHTNRHLHSLDIQSDEVITYEVPVGARSSGPASMTWYASYKERKFSFNIRQSPASSKSYENGKIIVFKSIYGRTS